MAESDKNTQLLVKINREQKYKFYEICIALDTHASREVRRMIKSFIKENKHVLEE